MSTEKPRKHILTLAQEFSLPLIAGVLAAIIWTNVAPAGYASFLHYGLLGSDITLHFLFNDIFMVFFFGIAAGEITEACLPGGALNPPSRAVNPLMATAGGVLGPIAVYLLWVSISGDQAIANGWGVPTATDIALAWLVARLIFGKGHPAVSFLLLLAVADDGIGLGIIAIKYPDLQNPVEPLYLLLVAAAMATAWAMRRYNARAWAMYIAGPGVLSWMGLHMAHLHPALALVAIVPFMPHAERDEGMFAEEEEDDDERPNDALNKFQHSFKLPVDVGLFGFGITNAGVVFSSIGNATWAVLVSLLVGKTLGIFVFSWIGDKLGFSLPEGMNKRSLFVAGVTAGLGLTVALFVAGQAFGDPHIEGAAKMGAVLSAVAAPIAIVLGRLFRVREPNRPPDDDPTS